MKLKGILIGLALSMAMVVGAKAQDEVPGSQSQIIAAVPTGGFHCGRATYPLDCYGVPANIGGTFWLTLQYKASPSPTGFIAFNGVADLGMATITSAVVTTDAKGNVMSADVTFKGMTNDGDGDSYTGTGHFTFSYYKSASGSGRGGGYPGMIMLMQSGTLTIQY